MYIGDEGLWCSLVGSGLYLVGYYLVDWVVRLLVYLVVCGLYGFRYYLVDCGLYVFWYCLVDFGLYVFWYYRFIVDCSSFGINWLIVDCTRFRTLIHVMWHCVRIESPYRIVLHKATRRAVPHFSVSSLN